MDTYCEEFEEALISIGEKYGITPERCYYVVELDFAHVVYSTANSKQGSQLGITIRIDACTENIGTWPDKSDIRFPEDVRHITSAQALELSTLLKAASELADKFDSITNNKN